MELFQVIALVWVLRKPIVVLLALTALLNSPLCHRPAPAAPSGPGVVYTQDQLAGALMAAGSSYAGARIGAAVAEAESGGRSDAVHLCPPRCEVGQAPEQSYGPWQVNRLAHPSVSVACAEELNCAARAAVAISDRGRDWSAWSTFTSHAYCGWMEVCR